MNNPNVYRGSIDCFLSAVCKLYVDCYMTARDIYSREGRFRERRHKWWNTHERRHWKDGTLKGWDPRGMGWLRDGILEGWDTRGMGYSRNGILEGWDTWGTGYSRNLIDEGLDTRVMGHSRDWTWNETQQGRHAWRTTSEECDSQGVGHSREWPCKEYASNVGNTSGCKRKSSFYWVEEDILVSLLEFGTEDCFSWVWKKWKLFHNLCLFQDSVGIIFFFAIGSWGGILFIIQRMAANLEQNGKSSKQLS